MFFIIILFFYFFLRPRAPEIAKGGARARVPPPLVCATDCNRIENGDERVVRYGVMLERKLHIRKPKKGCFAVTILQSSCCMDDGTTAEICSSAHADRRYSSTEKMLTA